MWKPNESVRGFSRLGISESFGLEGPRSLYGTTKLASELIIQEYGMLYDLKFIINRCGLIAGPWQMGKSEQGVVTLWVARHLFDKKLDYIGYGGSGKQVRDVLNISDLFRLIQLQLEKFTELSGQTFNVGGGIKNSVSLMELTELCRQITGKKIPIQSIREDRFADLRIYISDNSLITRTTGWTPECPPAQTVEEISRWIKTHRQILEPVLCG